MHCQNPMLDERWEGEFLAGFPGACAAGLGVFLPVYLFVVLAGPSYRHFAQNEQIRAFVQGVTTAATGAIAGAVIVLARHSIHDWWTLAIAVTTCRQITWCWPTEFRTAQLFQPPLGEA
jgi:chromate transport protein ChrA